MSSSLANKTFALTAAGSGIGLVTAILLARSHASAISICDIDPNLFDIARDKLLAINPNLKLLFTQVDITDSSAVTAWIDLTISNFHALDGCVNCGGTINFASSTTAPLFLSETNDTWRRVWSLNLDSVFYCLRAEVAAMQSVQLASSINQSTRSIVNIASAASLVHDPSILSYSLSKRALVDLTTTISKDVASLNIRVNCVSPSATRTGMALRWYKDEQACEEDMAKRGITLLEPERVAEAIVWLLGEESRMVSGQNIAVGASEP